MRQATEAARRSVELNPDLAAAHIALGLVLLRSKQFDEGVAALRRAIDLDPMAANGHIGIGEYHQARGELKEAEAAYREAARLAPDDWHPLTQGYAPGGIQGEPELVNVRGDVRHHRMLAEHQAGSRARATDTRR